MGNHFFELEPGNYQSKKVSWESYRKSDLLQFSWDDDIVCNIVDLVTNVGYATNSIYLEDMFWILYFDVECTKNTTGYEALGLKRVIELNVKYMKLFGNSGENPFQQQLKETHPKWSL